MARRARCSRVRSSITCPGCWTRAFRSLRFQRRIIICSWSSHLFSSRPFEGCCGKRGEKGERKNMPDLKGKTLFITGASRGIGKAMGLRAARDDSNIAIAAKTVTQHPKLPGTIYTAAAEMESAGGKALACAVDIRFEDQIRQAVAKAVETFGGVDILINNASAISLTGTLATPMPRFDRMHQVNVRGTFACSQACIPHLLKASNPHILNIAPPPLLEARWFAAHAAYTMAKYGMSLCVLGMAAEFRGQGLSSNALWARPIIAT